MTKKMSKKDSIEIVHLSKMIDVLKNDLEKSLRSERAVIVGQRPQQNEI